MSNRLRTVNRRICIGSVLVCSWESGIMAKSSLLGFFLLVARIPPFAIWDSSFRSQGSLIFLAGIPPLQGLCLPGFRNPAFWLHSLRLLLLRFLRLSVLWLALWAKSVEALLCQGTPTPPRASTACGLSSPEDSSQGFVPPAFGATFSWNHGRSLKVATFWTSLGTPLHPSSGLWLRLEGPEEHSAEISALPDVTSRRIVSIVLHQQQNPCASRAKFSINP